jgi:hypothetical protein
MPYDDLGDECYQCSSNTETLRPYKKLLYITEKGMPVFSSEISVCYPCQRALIQAEISENFYLVSRRKG